MITGNIAGFEILPTGAFLQGVNPSTGEVLEEKFSIADQMVIDHALNKAVSAFKIYKKWSANEKASFLEKIAEEILALDQTLIKRIHLETGLAEARIMSERGRTISQLKMFAELLREGTWTQATIDLAIPDRSPLPKADIRKILRPIGPVVVYSASNFPLAYSTAGGDVASALAAGCPVILKAHESHPGTNALVAEAILKAAKAVNAPDGVFSTLYGYGPELGQALVGDSRVKAIGFTGSLRAGRAIMDTAAKRKEPIPVHAEMGSLNPVFITQSVLVSKAEAIGEALAASVSLGAGQFCTKPGLILIEESPHFDTFYQALENKLSQVPSHPMLNARIHSNFLSSISSLSKETKVKDFYSGDALTINPAISVVSLEKFKENSSWHHEIFGPFAMIIRCPDIDGMLSVLPLLSGQLTITLWSELNAPENEKILDTVEEYTGRIVWNGVPTGVEVCASMTHGGPYPATSNAQYSAVGQSAINRWCRPVSYQNMPEPLLPETLRGL